MQKTYSQVRVEPSIKIRFSCLYLDWFIVIKVVNFKKVCGPTKNWDKTESKRKTVVSPIKGKLSVRFGRFSNFCLRMLITYKSLFYWV